MRQIVALRADRSTRRNVLALAELFEESAASEHTLYNQVPMPFSGTSSAGVTLATAPAHSKEVAATSKFVLRVTTFTDQNFTAGRKLRVRQRAP